MERNVPTVTPEFRTGSSSNVLVSIPLGRYESLIKNEFVFARVIETVLDYAVLTYDKEELRIDDGREFCKILTAFMPDTFKKKLADLQEADKAKQEKKENAE